MPYISSQLSLDCYCKSCYPNYYSHAIKNYFTFFQNLFFFIKNFLNSLNSSTIANHCSTDYYHVEKLSVCYFYLKESLNLICIFYPEFSLKIGTLSNL